MRLIAFISILLSACASPDDSRTKILIIDSGIYKNSFKRSIFCQGSHKYQNDIYKPEHGTNIVSLASKNVDFTKFCIYYVAIDFKTATNYEDTLKKFKDLTNVKVINLSIAGDNFIQEESDFIKNSLNKGTIINVAAGNDGKTYNKSNCKVYPACLVYTLQNNKFRVVHNKSAESSNKLLGIPYYGHKGTLVGRPKLTGTSQATAIQTNKDILNEKIAN